jgi:DNA-binding NarL/FixJ family response regulator
MSTATPPRTVWALVEDLFFRAKVEALCAPAGRPVVVHREASSLLSALQVARDAGSALPAAIVIELGGRTDQGAALLEGLRVISHAPPTLGFYSHVETELRRRALELGATRVVPRSVLVKDFDALIDALSEEPDSRSGLPRP